MSFRNAAVIVVARIFRLISRTGQTLMEMGARTATSGSGVIGSSFTFFHYIANITNSSIVWTQNSPSITDFDIIGPGNVNGSPTVLQMTADPLSPHRQAVVLSVDESSSSGVGSNASLFMDNDDNEHPRFILYADYGEVTPPFKSVGIRGELTSVATILELGSPTVPIGSTAPNGTVIGRHYARGAPLAALNAAPIALTLAFQNACSVALTCVRDRFAADVTGVMSVVCTVAGNTDAICRLLASGGSYGGGTVISQPGYFNCSTAVTRATVTIVASIESVQTPGTVITLTLQVQKDVAVGNPAAEQNLTYINVAQFI